MATTGSEKKGNDRFAAELIRASKVGLAAFAAEEVARRGQPTEHDPQRFQVWARRFEHWLEYLAAAIGADRAEVFASAVASARESATDDDPLVAELVHGLRSLHSVLQSSLPEAAGEIAGRYIEVAERACTEDVRSPTSFVDPSQVPFGSLTAQYLAEVLQGNRTRASEVALKALHAGSSVRDVYMNLLVPAQREIGRMWHTGAINVAEEHKATAATELVMSRLRLEFPPATPRGRSVMAASVQGDHHSIGIRMVADFFELDGWNVTYLGSNVPSLDLAQCLVDQPHDLLALAVTLPPQLSSAEELIEELRDAPELRRLRILVGGTAFVGTGDLWREMGADGFAIDAESAIHVGRLLVENPLN